MIEGRNLQRATLAATNRFGSKRPAVSRNKSHAADQVDMEPGLLAMRGDQLITPDCSKCWQQGIHLVCKIASEVRLSAFSL